MIKYYVYMYVENCDCGCIELRSLINFYFFGSTSTLYWLIVEYKITTSKDFNPTHNTGI